VHQPHRLIKGGTTDPSSRRTLLEAPDPRLESLLVETLEGRPEPIRRYDQIHMVLSDAAQYLSFIAPICEGKRVIFMGDSDGLALGLAVAAGQGILPSPKQVTLCDFDQRVLQFVQEAAKSGGVSDFVSVELYNVFDPLPKPLQMKFDVFHTNPPYGRYNSGRSVMAFLERCFGATRIDGEGILVLGNDPRYPWTEVILRDVLQYLIGRKVTPSQVLTRVHRYILDDEPELESGFIHCANIAANSAADPSGRLDAGYRKNFYGRRGSRVPASISLDGVPVQLRMEFFS